MSDAVAHATLTFAATTSAVNGTGKGGGAGNLAKLGREAIAPSGEAAAGRSGPSGPGRPA
jgi:hypothetical protein